jgi:very-long-chain enoyl-CoA reductase
MTKINITSLSGKPLTSLTLSSNATLADLRVDYKKARRVNIERQAFYYVNADGKKGEMIKGDKTPLTIKENDTLMFKDLGPQIGYRTVFLVEYFGPLTAFPIIYLLRPFIYGAKELPALSYVQLVATALFCLHFLKRELETLFVHKFSNGYMPLFNIFKNTGYYTACAYYIAYYVLHPQYTDPPVNWVHGWAVLVVLNMIGNLICHIILSNLRPPGTTERRIPRGFLFELVSCPNYTFEIAMWICYSFMTRTIAGFVFAVLGGGQMALWAIKKHQNYRKEFKDYPRSRKVLVPYLF